MSFWTAIIILAAIGAFYSLRRNRDRARFSSSHPEQLPSQREAELERELEELRERVKVLERIATEDRGAKAIADEIESLRDK
jgi:hypothetical protein